MKGYVARRTRHRRTLGAWLLGCAAVCMAMMWGGTALATSRESPANPGQIVSLGLLVSTPAFLQTGLGAGAQVHGQLAPIWARSAWAIRAGAAASWAGIEEDSPHWHVTHHELRAMMTVEAAWTRGAGAWLLRAGAGAVWVLEERVRHQSARLPSGEITSSGQALAPEARLQVGARIPIAGPISAIARFGPSLRWVNGGLAGGVAGTLEVAWTR